MGDGCGKNGSSDGDTILWIAVGVMFVSLFLNLFL
jgi:hypothetical protein